MTVTPLKIVGRVFFTLRSWYIRRGELYCDRSLRYHRTLSHVVISRWPGLSQPRSGGRVTSGRDYFALISPPIHFVTTSFQLIVSILSSLSLQDLLMLCHDRCPMLHLLMCLDHRNFFSPPSMLSSIYPLWPFLLLFINQSLT